MPRFSKTVLADTGFWYALYDPRDQHHDLAEQKWNLLENLDIIIPWPSLYEVLNSRFTKNKVALKAFQILTRSSHVYLLPDEPYRTAALETCFSAALAESRTIALVDMVIRMMLADIKIRKHGLVTFNARDFMDVCAKHGIEII